jgi:hypothetical protein
MSAYDKDRVNKISQIMPEFSKVVQKGDTVLMGLEGDPLFPYSQNSRPGATVSDVKHRNNDSLITLSFSDGSRKEVSSLSLAADQVWEFDDDSFRNVMQRQQQKNEQMTEKYRGVGKSSEIDQLKQQIDTLTRSLELERENNKNFHNTMIASMNEMASDICGMDSSGRNAEFCRTLKSEYGKLMASRAESKLSNTNQIYRGTQELDFSDDDTDFF